MFTVLHNHAIQYPTPVTLTWSWNWGSLTGIGLIVQIVTGLFLAMHYDVALPFDSIQYIVRDVPGGVWSRMLHQNGASLFFYCLYVHMWRSLRFGSYTQPRDLLWAIGVAIMLLGMAVAFLGYVLPWGQMSFWGATVITSLLGVVPVVGEDLVHWLWGGFCVDTPTLNRFFSLHYLLPFIMCASAITHLVVLHVPGSSNPLEIPAVAYQVVFTTYFTWKDVAGLAVYGVVYLFIMSYFPGMQGYTSHPDNLMRANPYATPAHIVPEWYFLWVYAMLRSVPHKTYGVVLVVCAVVGLFTLPSMHETNLAWLFLLDLLVLTWVGELPMSYVSCAIGRVATAVFIMIVLAALAPLIPHLAGVALAPGLALGGVVCRM
jgi:ubiquinol-cytochrome c reductase cytochrome b subunit